MNSNLNMWGKSVIEKALQYANSKWIACEKNVMHGVDEAGRFVDTPDITWKGETLDCGWWKVGEVNGGIPYGWGNASTLEEFENEFKKYIANEEISKEIIYLNLDKVSSDFHKNLKDKYFNDYMKTKKNLILNQNNLYAIEDGKVKNMLYEQNKKINLKDVEYFLKTNGVVEK